MASKPSFERPVLATVIRRAREPRRFIQVLAGPRQVGKTTLARQAMDAVDLPSHYASADDPSGRDRVWLEQQWELGRLLARESRRGALLVLDEAQKIAGWPDLVKLLWDEDTAAGTKLRVFLLGSAPLLVGRGLAESLAGRFETIPVTHWSLPEMRDAFGWDVDRYLYFGGYPGAAPLVRDEERWRAYVLDSLVETTISRDVLLMTRIDKPALFRQLFALACAHSGQILSYTKMLGQLQDAGNTTTLAHYLELLAGAGLVRGLPKHSGSQVRSRGSSPKLVALNTALMSASSGRTFREARADREWWGRLVETAVGAALVNGGAETSYWRERNLEVDYVVRTTGRLAAFEVASGTRKDAIPGMAEFARRYPEARTFLVGAQGIALEEFLGSPASRWTR
jgi:uncharacterized protein